MLAKTLLERPLKNLTLFNSKCQAQCNVKLNTTSEIELWTGRSCQCAKAQLSAGDVIWGCSRLHVKYKKQRTVCLGDKNKN